MWKRVIAEMQAEKEAALAKKKAKVTTTPPPPPTTIQAQPRSGVRFEDEETEEEDGYDDEAAPLLPPAAATLRRKQKKKQKAKVLSRRESLAAHRKAQKYEEERAKYREQAGSLHELLSHLPSEFLPTYYNKHMKKKDQRTLRTCLDHTFNGELRPLLRDDEKALFRADRRLADRLRRDREGKVMPLGNEYMPLTMTSLKCARETVEYEEGDDDGDGHRGQGQTGRRNEIDDDPESSAFWNSAVWK
jgi:hypothetical protein